MEFAKYNSMELVTFKHENFKFDVCNVMYLKPSVYDMLCLGDYMDDEFFR